MEISIKDNGKMEWLMVLELFVILKEVSMRVNGLKISNMVRELSTGTIIRSNMKEISLKEKNRVKVNSNVKEVHLLEILRMVNSTVRIYYFADSGKIYRGNFVHNKPHGKGEMTWPD